MKTRKIYKIKKGHEEKCQNFLYYKGAFIRVDNIYKGDIYYSILDADKNRVIGCGACFKEGDLEPLEPLEPLKKLSTP